MKIDDLHGARARPRSNLLEADLLMEFFEDTIESVHGQHFADSGVMIQNHGAGILGTIVVAHANVRPADKGRVTEDDPRFLRAGEKALPENMKSNRHIRAVAGYAGFGNSAVQKAVRGNGDDGSEHDRECNDSENPGARGPAIDLQIAWH